jgi:hypothetical protein
MSLPASAYAIVPNPPPQRASAVQRKAAAREEHSREARLKCKIDQASRVLDRIDRQAAALAAQMNALAVRKAALTRRTERIEDRVLSEMLANRLEKVSGNRVTFTARAAAAALVVDNESLVPSEFLREKLVSSVDKIAIKLALAKGADVPGVSLAQKVSLIRS